MSFKFLDEGISQPIPLDIFDENLKVDPHPTIEISPENEMKHMSFGKIISPTTDSDK